MMTSETPLNMPMSWLHQWELIWDDEVYTEVDDRISVEIDIRPYSLLCLIVRHKNSNNIEFSRTCLILNDKDVSANYKHIVHCYDATPSYYCRDVEITDTGLVFGDLSTSVIPYRIYGIR